MISGLISRYQQAGVDPPVLLYVDTGCCIEEGQSKLQTRFGEWPTLNIRLDIWHFMQNKHVASRNRVHHGCPSPLPKLHGKAIWMHIWVGPTWHCSFTSGEERATGGWRAAFHQWALIEQADNKKRVVPLLPPKDLWSRDYYPPNWAPSEWVKGGKRERSSRCPSAGHCADWAHLACSKETCEVHPGCARCVALHRDGHHHYQGRHSAH